MDEVGLIPKLNDLDETWIVNETMHVDITMALVSDKQVNLMIRSGECKWTESCAESDW